MKKAITHIKLDQANPSKLQKLNELAVEHQRVVQAYVNWLIAHELRQPDKYADIPERAVPTVLSDRWQRCAWQQACGMVQSWYSNARTHPPRQKPCATNTVIGIDIGMAAIATASTGQSYGHVSDRLALRVEKQASRLGRKQKLNACLKKKGLPVVRLDDQWAEAFARNAIGRALNALLADLPVAAPIAVERLQVKDMRFKSRLMNRRLRASQLGYIKDKLRFKLDDCGLRYRSVQPAYTSQQCSRCGCVSELNRKTQAEFVCHQCGFVCHADVNAAQNIAERFNDAELNQLPFRAVKALLEQRFRQGLSPDARSASAGLDT